jgi:hypothetical protein
MADMALVLELTLLEKALRLLSGLDSEPSKLGTLRIVADLTRACLATVLVGRAAVMLFIVPVEAGVRVFVAEASNSGASLCSSVGATSDAID